MSIFCGWLGVMLFMIGMGCGGGVWQVGEGMESVDADGNKGKAAGVI